MEETNIRIVLVTCGSQEEGKRIAQAIVSEKLAACANIVPGILSLYWWDGAVQEDSECLLVIKTVHNLLPELEARVKSLHSYTVPEFIATSVIYGSNQYLDWVVKSTLK